MMIDLHCHILFGVDDGAQSIQQSIRMAKQAVESGIKKICATPHLPAIDPDDFAIIAQTKGITLGHSIKSEGLDLLLFGGFELHLNYIDIWNKSAKKFTINRNGKYLLIELPIGDFPKCVEQVFYNLLSEGLIPIFAHPERNIDSKKQIERIARLVESGVLIQLNASSLLGEAGAHIRKLAVELLKQELVHLLASDAHNPDSRTCGVLSDGFAVACKLVGKDKASALVFSNPLKILEGKRLDEINTPVCWQNSSGCQVDGGDSNKSATEILVDSHI